jgi:hypothetical protein
VLIGREKDFGWSLTSADSQNTDQFLVALCNADGSAPTRTSTAYLYKDQSIDLPAGDQLSSHG